MMEINMKKLALVGGVVLIAATLIPAQAICPTARLITSDLAYIYTPGICDAGFPCPGESSVTENFKAVYWVVGAGDPAPGPGNDSGTFPARQLTGDGYYLAGFVTNYPTYPAYLNGSWGQSQEIDGCPDFVAAPGTPGLCMTLVMSDQSNGQSYFMAQNVENDANGNYRFAGGMLSSLDREGGIPGGPTISSSLALGAAGIELTINPPELDGIAQAQGCPDAVAGYRVYAQVVPTDTQPPVDRSPSSGWVEVSGGVTSDPVTVQVSCTDNEDVYIATSAVFDSGFETAFVSANSTRVECGANAADVEDVRPRIRPGQRIELKRDKKGGRR